MGLELHIKRLQKFDLSTSPHLSLAWPQAIFVILISKLNKFPQVESHAIESHALFHTTTHIH